MTINEPIRNLAVELETPTASATGEREEYCCQRAVDADIEEAQPAGCCEETI